MPPQILQIAVPTPLYRNFDYLAPAVGSEAIIPGNRVLVPFGKRLLVGIVVTKTDRSEFALNKLKPVKVVLSDPLPTELLDLLSWASSYYHHPLGEVLNNALPVLLRQPESPELSSDIWTLTEAGQQIDPEALTRAPRQAELLRLLAQQADGMDKTQLDRLDFNWRDSLRTLMKKDWVKRLSSFEAGSRLKISRISATAGHPLNSQQQLCVDTLATGLGHFQTYLLQGITGSGKTEVYLQLVEQVLAQQKQSLVLVPEINLTPQLIERFEKRFSVPIAVLHSGMNNTQRLLAWQRARDNQVQIIIGTRSALFTPLAAPGLIIIDEEHDSSYKQQDNFRYHARDLALVRAKRLGIPVLLGSATPSLESLYNCEQGRYQLLKLTERAGAATPPKIQLLDVRRRPMQEGLSDHFIELMHEHLKQNSQVLLFLNRRGFAPALFCHECGWVMPCPRCDAKLTYHQQRNLMRCHHCGHETRPPTQCPECQNDELITMGIGTERLEKHLLNLFPEYLVSRIDSDTTSRKGSLDQKLEEARSGKANILIGTQMLAKGHDFPHVTLVGILDVDSSLFSADFRAPEFMAQQLIQVAGRAGRAEKPGHVVIQTHHPEHPLLQTLLTEGYESFAYSALAERQLADFPPYTSLAILRAEATIQSAPAEFLRQCAELFSAYRPAIDVFGPLPSPMERRAGRYRYQLLLQSASRQQIQQSLRQIISRLAELPSAKKVRWSIDVDPVSML